jgi:hypothetical protein
MRTGNLPSCSGSQRKAEGEKMSEQASATAADVMRPPLTVEQQGHVAAAAYLMKHAGTTP